LHITGTAYQTTINYRGFRKYKKNLRSHIKFDGGTLLYIWELSLLIDKEKDWNWFRGHLSIPHMHVKKIGKHMCCVGP